MNKFIIFFIILGLIFINYKKKKTSENLKKQMPLQQINIKYLTKNEGCKILTNENLEKYISNFTIREMKSRYCINEIESNEFTNLSFNRLVDECKVNYCRNVLNFNTEEIMAINKLVKEISISLNDIYPLFPVHTWKFIKVNEFVENGLPHTREDCIVLPKSEIEKLINYQKNVNERFDMVDIGGLLIHEKIHIFQRYNPNFFNYLYTNIWPFKKARKIFNLPKQENQRSNPDALEQKWVYKDKNNQWYLPTSELSYEKNYDLRYPLKFGIKLKSIGNYDYIADPQNKIKLNSLKEYYDNFCKIGQNYHPNEISAVLMSKVCLYKMGYTSLNENEILCLNPVIKWMSNNLSY